MRGKRVPERPLLRKQWRLCWLSPKTVRRTMRPSIAGSHPVGLQLTDPFLSYPPNRRGCAESPGCLSSIHSASYSFLRPIWSSYLQTSRDFFRFFSPTIWLRTLGFVNWFHIPYHPAEKSLYGRLLHLLASAAEPHKSASRHFAYLLKLKYTCFGPFVFYWPGWQRFLLLACLYLFVMLRIFVNIH